MQNEFSFRIESRQDDLLCDFTDGTVYKDNIFFQENAESFKIILYQDSFELVNPIGAAKTKHKILAIYMMLGNIPDYLRGHVNSIKLVTLCKEKEFDYVKVYRKIFSDLKEIEKEGIEINSKFVKGSLVYIAGDNLGSHGLGGFTENFSTAKYMCRFCLVTKDEFNSEGGCCKFYLTRTVESYN